MLLSVVSSGSITLTLLSTNKYLSYTSIIFTLIRVFGYMLLVVVAFICTGLRVTLIMNVVDV